jgi:hypothetical protein
MLLLPVATPTPTAVAQANCLPRPSHMPVHMTIPNPFVAWYFIYQISFLVIRATLPTLVVRALGCRDDGGWYGLQVRPRPPHYPKQVQPPLLTKYILCMSQAWLQRYNYKQPNQFFSELNEKQAQELNKVMNYQLLFIFLKFNIVIPQSLILFPPSIAKNILQQERTYVWLRQKTMKPLIQPLIWCQKPNFISSVCVVWKYHWMVNTPPVRCVYYHEKRTKKKF